jgi:amidase
MNSLETLLFLAWVSFFQSLLPETVSMTMAQASNSQDFPDLYEASIAELQEGLKQGQFTSVDLVKVHHLTRLLLINTSYSFA